MGKFKDAMEKLDDVEVSYLSPEHQYQGRIAACRALCITRQGKYQEGMDLADKVAKAHKGHTMCKEALLDTTITKAFALSALGRIEEGLELCFSE